MDLQMDRRGLFALKQFAGWGLLAALIVNAISLPTSADEVPRRSAIIAQVDLRIDERLKQAGVTPAGLSDDAEFIRRVSLDLTGIMPRVVDVRKFLADQRPDKRARLIEQLLESPAHATHLADTWRGIMLPGGGGLEQIGSVIGVQNWLHERFTDNLRYDNLVSELLVATAGADAGPALYYTSLDVAPEKLAASTARIFLGVQIECAQCHDHPFDHWKQKDFWGYAAFFARLDRPAADNPAQQAVRLVDLEAGEVKLPNSETIVLPKYPGGTEPSESEAGTRRMQLAIWMASRDNPYLARAALNRVWAQLFGRGLVEPLDDFSPKNLPSHPELLDELTSYFVEGGFDLRELYRTLTQTAVYQRTSRWEGTEPAPPELFAHAAVKVLTPEQLYDSLVRVTGRPTSTGMGMAGGSAATNRLIDPRRQAFLGKMGPAARSAVEYSGGVLQALTQMNGDETALATNPAQSPLLGALEAPLFSDEGRVEILYLAAFSRPPQSDERADALAYLAAQPTENRSAAVGDLLWSLLNSAEFGLNH